MLLDSFCSKTVLYVLIYRPCLACSLAFKGDTLSWGLSDEVDMFVTFRFMGGDWMDDSAVEQGVSWSQEIYSDIFI